MGNVFFDQLLKFILTKKINQNKCAKLNEQTAGRYYLYRQFPGEENFFI